MEMGEQSRIRSKMVQISRGSQMGGNISPILSLVILQFPKLEILESYLSITTHLVHSGHVVVIMLFTYFLKPYSSLYPQDPCFCY